MNRDSNALPWLWAPLVLLVDFVTKRLVLAHADRLLDHVDVIGTLARFTYVRNPGAAMGIAFGGRTLLITISMIAALALILLYRHTPSRLAIRRCAIAAILGGALGNLVDRIFYDGLVVDFIDLGIGAHRFYTFNVADMGVTLGGVVLFLSLWREGREEQSARRDDDDLDPSPSPLVVDDDA